MRLKRVDYHHQGVLLYCKYQYIPYCITERTRPHFLSINVLHYTPSFAFLTLSSILSYASSFLLQNMFLHLKLISVVRGVKFHTYVHGGTLAPFVVGKVRNLNEII